jgi:hypothetical protein
MKKIIITTLILATLTACTEPTVQTKQTNIVIEYGQNPVEIVVIEGCEYLHYRHGHAYMLCHKGNCKNPIHPEHKKK